MYGKVTKQKTEPSTKPHVKKGDTVVVLAGKDRGKQAKVLRVMPTKGAAIVERVNLMKKHTKKNANKKGAMAHAGCASQPSRSPAAMNAPPYR